MMAGTSSVVWSFRYLSEVAERKTVSQLRQLFWMITPRSSSGCCFSFLIEKSAFLLSRFVKMKSFFLLARANTLFMILLNILLWWCWMMCLSRSSLRFLCGGSGSSLLCMCFPWVVLLRFSWVVVVMLFVLLVGMAGFSLLCVCAFIRLIVVFIDAFFCSQLSFLLRLFRMSKTYVGG